MTVTLFDPGPGTPVEVLSAGARRSAGQKALLAAGIHPVTNGRARPDLGTCGTCAHRIVTGHNLRSYHKCDLRPITAGPGTDIRVSWPACEKHVDVARLVDCGPCGADGWIDMTDVELARRAPGVRATRKRCSSCNGRGQVVV